MPEPIEQRAPEILRLARSAAVPTPPSEKGSGKKKKGRKKK